MRLTESDKRRAENIMPKKLVVNPNGCWDWIGGRDKDGYGKIMLNYKSLRSHRVAYMMAYGDLADGMMVCHTCDRPGCCNPAHLYAGTAADNNRDREHRSRSRKGVHHVKVNPVMQHGGNIILMQMLHGAGFPKMTIAACLRVGATTVSRVVDGTHWSHRVADSGVYHAR